MIPETISLCRRADEGGVLMGLYLHSMSLRSAVERGMFPPRHVLNHFLQCGYDDIALEVNCLESHRTAWAVLRWVPFTLTQVEYDTFVASLRLAGNRFVVRDLRASSYPAWFGRCFR